ncbi:MAG: hypothetical protein FWD55_03855, partial [Propionibacteriaceae bacterium]|nr:hypothetical protein [Propionibacteriaceae bacterium]
MKKDRAGFWSGVGWVFRRIWASEKWRCVIGAFLACKVAAPVVLIVILSLLSRIAATKGLPTLETFSPIGMWFQWDSHIYQRLIESFNYFAPLTSSEQDMIASSMSGKLL